MAASELNNRLDYLISYSSQLVFVCSDKIQQQSQVVESFLAHQNEQADLALLTANELTPLVTYREKLYRQLISQNQVADFNRPLIQLLAPLNNHSGPILISVFHAEKLPDKLVKELWDLVLQSRFANNKQHLNVLLMGLSDWAESAKSGLGAKSKEQPIVLNSQIETQHTETEEFSDLEAFIQDKRKKFAQRIEERHFQAYEPKPIYKKWWMAILLVLAFLAIFSGILGWQYPEKVQDILAFINNQQTVPEQQLTTSDVVTLVEPVSVEIAQKVPQAIEQAILETKPSITKKITTKDLLVTDWSTASTNSEIRANKVLLQTSSIDTPVDVQPKLTSIPETNEQITTVNAQTSADNDYQVEDQLTYKPIVEKSGVQLSSLNPMLTLDLLKPNHEVLMALPAENFLIQIVAMANISILENYIRDLQLGQQLWLYKTQRYGGDWYVLLQNQHFSSIEDARAEITSLDPSMLSSAPFVKSVKQVKQEISASLP
jgi:DamX protein